MDMGTNSNPLTDDFLTSYRLHQREYAEALLFEHREEIASFMAFAITKGVSLAPSDISYVDKIGIVASAPKLLDRLSGGLARERDGLVPFDTLRLNHNFDRPYPGYFQAENFIPMAHPHFRRGLHDECHFAPRFIELFWAFEQDGLAKYIALDENRVKLDIFLGEVMEKATWFGAPFNEDVSKVPNGITKLKPPPDLGTSHVSMFFADAYCLDIKWTQDGDVKTFQALEIKSEDTCLSSDGETFYPARYIHAEFDIAKGVFRHFDGAMQYYTKSEYGQRRDSDFNYNAKNRHQIKSRSRKLFKLNGQVGTTQWADLCCHFFADNPLMFEYFKGCYPDHVIDVLSRIDAAQRQRGT
jgi:hypothetical protein